MLNVIKTRRSVRKFDLSKKIPYETLVELCKYGAMAPSARNQQDREYVIVDDPKVIDLLSDVSKGAGVLKNANTAIVVLGKAMMDQTTPEMVPQDLAATPENTLLSALALNIGSCWIGIYPIDTRMILAKEALNINDDRFVFSIIALGYPEDNSVFEGKDKLDLSDIHHNEA